MFERMNLTSSQRQAMGQIMTQTHQQLEQLHTQVRSKVLGDLTPAHRSLLAQVIGSLAISPNPDHDAAVRQLNAALSPGEAQAVVSTHSAAMAQMKALMESAHQKFQAILTPQQRAQQPSWSSHGGPPNGGPPNGEPPMGMHSASQLTAGDILLHLASPDTMEGHMGMETHHSM
jgi:Spy/CpxP family protein refolding chaperone